MSENPRNLLLLDFTSETNLGDLALQEGLIRMVSERYPDAELAATVIYGANQAWEESPHFTQLRTHAHIRLGGSLRPTFYPLTENATDPLRMELRNAAGLLCGLLILALIAVDRRAAERLLPRRFAETCRLIREADVVLWKGKNFRGTRWAIEPYRVLSRLITPIAAHLYGKRMINVSSSVWRLNNPASRALLRAVLRRCEHVSVRESVSRMEVERLLDASARRPTVSQAPDLAFALLGDWIRRHTPLPADRGPRVALTLMDWPGPGPRARERYIRAIVGCVEHIAADPRASFRIVPQAVTPWESNDYVVDQVLARLAPTIRERVSVARGGAGIPGVLAEYRAADFLIATRMHSAIFALSVGTPVVAIACDHGAKWQILGDMGYGDFVIRYEDVGPKLLVERFESLRAQADTLMPRVYQAIAKQCRDVADHLRQLGPQRPYARRRAAPTLAGLTE